MCDFEEGLCEWEQLTNDEFDWTWQKGSTGTQSSGPSTDHTTGTEDGADILWFYLVILD